MYSQPLEIMVKVNAIFRSRKDRNVHLLRWTNHLLTVYLKNSFIQPLFMPFIIFYYAAFQNIDFEKCSFKAPSEKDSLRNDRYDR